ncbi:MAG: HpcH/HpaI aldolase/citrate lyase family protein [Armatimonadota bacterium]
MTGRQTRQALEAGRRVYGTMWARGLSVRWAPLLAGRGLDFVIIDNEHSPFSRTEVAELSFAFGMAGIAPLVRVPIPSSHYVTMAMDAGAHGVLAPYCETVDEVREVVAACKWRPLKGEFVERVMDSGEFPSDELRDYLLRRNADSFTIIGIESVPALESLEAILRVPGIDAIFVGPHDLSCSLGIPERYEHPQFEAAVQRVIDTCEAAGVAMTMHFSELRLTRKWMERGMRLVLFSSDLRLLPDAVEEKFAALREVGEA